MSRFQFQIDGRAVGPIRSKWGDAAQDAVRQEYGHWYGNGKVNLYNGAEIAQLDNDPLEDMPVRLPKAPESLHADPQPDGFTHESPIRAFTDWTVNGRYAIGKGFRPSLQHLTVYLDAMDRLEGWALLQILEAASGSPSFVFSKRDRSLAAAHAAVDLLAELGTILDDDERIYVQEILARAHFVIEGFGK